MNKLVRASGAAVAMLAGACAVEVEIDGASAAITMGDPATDQEFLSVGMLVARGMISEDGAAAESRIMGLCTGTLVSETAVLTAEHCVNQQILKQSIGQARDEQGNPRNLTIEGDVTFQFTFARSIATVMGGTAEVAEVSEVDHSETFAPLDDPLAALRPAPARWDDIAIVHLAEPIEGRPLQALATPEMVTALSNGDDDMYRAAGYGLTNDDDPMSAGTLTSGLSHLDELGEHELTAGGGDRQQACRGDSGGPLFSDETDNHQIGIASRVNKPLSLDDILSGKPPPCETGLAYTRVDAYLDWIAERVPDLPAPNDPGDPADGDEDASDPDGEQADDGADTSAESDANEDELEQGGESAGSKQKGGCQIAPGIVARRTPMLWIGLAGFALARWRRTRQRSVARASSASKALSSR